MSWLVDTNVISELAEKRPNPHVREWLLQQPAEELYLCTFTVAEVRFGILSRAPGRRTSDLLAWWEGVVANDFAGRVLPFDIEAADHWALIAAAALKSGRRLPLMDSLIAATARRHGVAVVTRNVSDFEACGVQAFSPWPT